MTEKASSWDLTDEEVICLLEKAEQEERDELLRHFGSAEELREALRRDRQTQG